jgi:hypothetical protein
MNRRGTAQQARLQMRHKQCQNMGHIMCALALRTAVETKHIKDVLLPACRYGSFPQVKANATSAFARAESKPLLLTLSFRSLCFLPVQLRLVRSAAGGGEQPGRGGPKSNGSCPLCHYEFAFLFPQGTGHEPRRDEGDSIAACSQSATGGEITRARKM